MRIIFMGTPDFAVPSLQALVDDGHEICAVFTQPDKPKGRGHKMQAPPVKELAMQMDLNVFQPATLRTGEALRQIEELKPEAIVVVAYGKILPRAILDTPKFGCINVHGSLLPKYRGAAPIQWAVINGDKTAGVTTMFMADGIDTGDMLLKEETLVGDEETAGELFERLKVIGAGILVETLRELCKGNLNRTAQEEAQATNAPMLSKEIAQIDWSKSAGAIHNLIRGLNPWPSAYTVIQGKKMKIHASRIEESFGGAAGSLKNISGELFVACGEGALCLTKLQPENSKTMDGRSYLLGHPLN